MFPNNGFLMDLSLHEPASVLVGLIWVFLVSFSNFCVLQLHSLLLVNLNCRIDDFEFTPECAIFDLLDIGLYHGWIVDPQVCFLTGKYKMFHLSSLFTYLFLLEAFLIHSSSYIMLYSFIEFLSFYRY